MRFPEEQEGQNLSQLCRVEEMLQQVWWKGEELTLRKAAAHMRAHLIYRFMQMVLSLSLNKH